jgi:hypothetical protein
MSTTLQQQILLEAADFFEKHPERWTQLRLSRKKNGHSTCFTSPTAYRFCAVGYLERLCNQYGLPRCSLQKYLWENHHSNLDTIIKVNDQHTFTAAKVVHVLRWLAQPPRGAVPKRKIRSAR